MMPILILWQFERLYVVQRVYNRFAALMIVQSTLCIPDNLDRSKLGS